jgi:very-short-patch-repair endonuclease
MAGNIVRGQTVKLEQIRRALELRKNQTPEEKILWQELRGGRLGVHFRRYQIIAGYFADFYFSLSQCGRSGRTRR